MPFIGNQPALSYTSFAKQDFTTSATTSYTLDNPVTNENELALFINFVRQEPTTAYTASGTSLTLTSATSASDDMYCVYLGKAVQTVNPPNGSVGASQIADSSIALGKLSATGTKDSTTFLRGDNTFATAGGTNTPAFEAYSSSTHSASGGAATKIQYNTEVFDSDNCYDNSTNYRFTPTTAGKYFIFASVQSTSSSDFDDYQVRINKNGSEYALSRIRHHYADNINVQVIVDMNGSSDYVEAFCYTASGITIQGTDRPQVRFGGYKIIE